MIDKQHVIEVGIDLFQKNGYANVTVSDICKASGIAYGTFFNHFETKSHLLMEYVLSQYSGRQFWIAAMKETSPLEKLMAMEMAMIQSTIEIGAPLMTQFLAFRVLEPQCWQKSHALHEQLTTAYCDLIRQAQEQHEIRNQSTPEDILTVMRDLCTANFSAWAMDPSINCQRQHGKTIEILLDVPPERRRNYV